MAASAQGAKIASCEDETNAKTMSTTTAIAIGQGDSPLRPGRSRVDESLAVDGASSSRRRS